jgi:predicted acylesterase/phospholipase RssA
MASLTRKAATGKKKSGAASTGAKASARQPAANSRQGAKASGQSARKGAKKNARRDTINRSAGLEAVASSAASSTKETTTAATTTATTASASQSTASATPKASKGKIPNPKIPPTIALALSGGGAKGSFQLGALKYLYERVFDIEDDEPLPTVMSGTSVGAVNATKLSEGGKAAFVGLEKIWMGLQRNEDMYEEADWVTTLKKLNRRLLGNVGKDGFSFTEIAGLGLEYLFQDEIEDIDFADIKAAFSRAADSKSINHLGPLAKIIDGGGLDVNKVMASKIKLRLATVYLRGGQLRYVTEKGEVLERDNKTVVNWAGKVGKGEWGRHEPWYPEPCRAIAKKVKDEINVIVKSKTAEKENPIGGEEIHPKKPDKTVNKEYETAIEAALVPLHQCLKAHPIIHLRYGVLASSAIPCVFEPFRIHGDYYVDGGVREVLPIQVAIDCGATKIYAIACGLAKSEPPPYINNIADVGARALNITLDEIVQDETTRIPKWLDKPVVLIRPNVEVHDALTIDPGLIRIAAAYGYMCAADTIELAGEDDDSKTRRAEAQALADKMTRYRKSNWEDEDISAKKHESVPFKNVDPLKGMAAGDKQSVRGMARDRLAKGFSLPPNIERAWMSWECHRLAQFFPVIWPESDKLPNVCKPLKKTLDDLEKQKGKLITEEHTIEKGEQKPQKGEKGPKDPELKELEEQIKKARANLLKCIHDNTIVNTGSHGLLIKSKSSKDVFILYGGSKLLLRGADPMGEMQYDAGDVLVIPNDALARLPQDKPADGTILGNRSGETFIMEKGKKKKITVVVPEYYDPKKYDLSFTSMEQEAREVKLVPSETLKAIP